MGATEARWYSCSREAPSGFRALDPLRDLCGYSGAVSALAPLLGSLVAAAIDAGTPREDLVVCINADFDGDGDFDAVVALRSRAPALPPVPQGAVPVIVRSAGSIGVAWLDFTARRS